MTDTTTTFIALLEKLRETVENLKQLEELKGLDRINKQLDEVIELLMQIRDSLSVFCKQIVLEKLSKYFNKLKKSCNYISSYTDNLSRILYADNSVNIEVQLKYIEDAIQSAKDIRKTLSLIERVGESLYKLSYSINDLEKCSISVKELRNNIITNLNNLLHQLNEIKYFVQQAQYSIEELESWVAHLAEELLSAISRTEEINQNNYNLLERFRRFSRYLIGYATIIRYYAFISPVVGLKSNEIVDLIKQLNKYLFDNHYALLLDSINNTNININIRNKIKKELKRIFSKTRYSPLMNNEIKELINDTSLSNHRESLKKIIEGFVLGDRKYIEPNNRLLSIFNDLEQVILNLIAIIILLDNVRNSLNKLCDYIEDYFY